MKSIQSSMAPSYSRTTRIVTTVSVIGLTAIASLLAWRMLREAPVDGPVTVNDPQQSVAEPAAPHSAGSQHAMPAPDQIVPANPRPEALIADVSDHPRSKSRSDSSALIQAPIKLNETPMNPATRIEAITTDQSRSTTRAAPATSPDKKRGLETAPRRRDQARADHREHASLAAPGQNTQHDTQPNPYTQVTGLEAADLGQIKVPDGQTVVELLEEDYDGTLELIYQAGEQDWGEGNVLMREVTETVMEDSSLEEQLAWVESLPDGPMKGSAAGRIIEQWGGENAITSLHWALSMEDEGARGSALSAAFGKWGAGAGGGHPELGATMIDNLENERDRDFALNGYASGLVGSDPELALELAESISNTGLRDAAVKRLTRQISRIKPKTEP
ncbi:MAG: hypothetical protein ACI9TH_001580 [Kiritimatiellia bacterium]|jgi:hypothetical protein